MNWIDWNGGECPVDDDTKIVVLFKDDILTQEGQEADPRWIKGASGLDWSADCSCPIIKYAVVD